MLAICMGMAIEDDDDLQIIEPPTCAKDFLNEDCDPDGGEEDLVVTKSKLTIQTLPHARYHCLVHRFGQSVEKNERNFCKLCFCYVCDCLASKCTDWSVHSQANDVDEKWRWERQRLKSKSGTCRELYPPLPPYHDVEKFLWTLLRSVDRATYTFRKARTAMETRFGVCMESKKKVLQVWMRDISDQLDIQAGKLSTGAIKTTAALKPVVIEVVDERRASLTRSAKRRKRYS
mmetsp:Transcript_33540/g.54350  ORF Transcript_33540/g.54350 Transcript_33540/m.54350 type:complete len:232 (+) Transcript_33540:78-773(+)